jgi:hypothetical protein
LYSHIPDVWLNFLGNRDALNSKWGGPAIARYRSAYLPTTRTFGTSAIPPLESDSTELNQTPALAFCLSMILRPVSTFPDHAPTGKTGRGADLPKTPRMIRISRGPVQPFGRVRIMKVS